MGGYLFSGSFTPLGDYDFSSQLLKRVSSLFWKALPIPLPFDYVCGFDAQLVISQGKDPFYAGYLMGEWSLEGWWYYYIIAFVVKNPLALLVIVLLTIVSWCWGKSDKSDFEAGLCIWIPVFAFLFYFSFFTNIPIGIRFLLPLFPLIFLAAGRLCQTSVINRKWARVVMVVVVTGYLIPAVAIFPDYLSYFNLAAGGPKKGHHWLIHSNLDLGQDLPRLKQYMERRGIEKVNLGYFGRVDPRIYGIDYRLAKQEVAEGVSAISVNFLAGRPYYLLEGDSKGLVRVDPGFFSKYRDLRPSATLGNTIYVFDQSAPLKPQSLAKTHQMNR